jgi:hypothetical protein
VSDLANLLFALAAALLGGVVGWFATPLVWVPWQLLKHLLAVLVAQLGRVAS